MLGWCHRQKFGEEFWRVLLFLFISNLHTDDKLDERVEDLNDKVSKSKHSPETLTDDSISCNSELSLDDYTDDSLKISFPKKSGKFIEKWVRL